jgi:hypothetical protein
VSKKHNVVPTVGPGILLSPEAGPSLDQVADSVAAVRASGAFDSFCENGPLMTALRNARQSVPPATGVLDRSILDAIINPPIPVKLPPAEPEPPPSPNTEVERLEFERAVLEEELAVLTEEPARVAHPDDDWGEWPYKKR